MTVETTLAAERVIDESRERAERIQSSTTMVVSGRRANAPRHARHLSRGVEMPKPTCSVDGCERDVYARGWCEKHYGRWRAHGDPLTTLLRSDMTVVERFHDSYVVSDDGCWRWQRAIKHGYGQFHDEDHKLRQAHRWSYLRLVGPIPDGLQLDHLCRNRSCVNPAHLEPVTPQENVRRGALGVLKTHCAQGHLLDGTNAIYLGRDRRRRCRICVAEATRRWEAKKRGL